MQIRTPNIGRNLGMLFRENEQLFIEIHSELFKNFHFACIYSVPPYRKNSWRFYLYIVLAGEQCKIGTPNFWRNVGMTGRENTQNFIEIHSETV